MIKNTEATTDHELIRIDLATSGEFHYKKCRYLWLHSRIPSYVVRGPQFQSS